MRAIYKTLVSLEMRDMRKSLLANLADKRTLARVISVKTCNFLLKSLKFARALWIYIILIFSKHFTELLN